MGYRFFLVSVVAFLFSCNSKPTDAVGITTTETYKYNPFERLYENRTISTGTDSLELRPFVMYWELELVGVERGMMDVLVFKTPYEQNPLIRVDAGDISSEGSSNLIELKSANSGSRLTRNIEYKTIYQAIVYYSIDEVAVAGTPTCDYSSYRLVDIVPKGELFDIQMVDAEAIF